MSDLSTNLLLPYLAAGQAQKHVTVNEALQRLDALVQLVAVSATVSAQPTSPTDGSVYILSAGKTGAQWGAMADNALAYFVDGAWQAITPREGWLAWVSDSNQLLVYDGASWSQSALRVGLGVGTAALENIATSGSGVPKLNAANTWSAAQIFSVPPVFTDKPGSLVALGATETQNICAKVAMSSASTWFFGPAGSDANELNALFLATRACIITRVLVLTVAPGGVETRTVTVRRGLAGTAMSGQIVGAAATLEITANPVALAKNDYYTVAIANSGAAAAASFCLVAIELTPA